MVRVSWLSREVWDGWDWIFGIGFVLLLGTAGLWSVHVLFLLPLILGIAAVGVLKRQERTTGGVRDG